MKPSVKMILLMALSLFAAGCATRPTTAGTYNPMPGIWASIAGEIAALKKVNATRTQWTKAAHNATEIATLSQLHAAIACTGTPADDAERLRRDGNLERHFRSSHSTVHFSWDGDFHAIVFFAANGDPKYVHP